MQTAPGQIKATGGVPGQYATVVVVGAHANHGLALGHQKGTDVHGSQALKGGNAHK